MRHSTAIHLLTGLILLGTPGMVWTQSHPRATSRFPAPGDHLIQERASRRDPNLHDDRFPQDRDLHSRNQQQYNRDDRFHGPAYPSSTEVDEVWVRHYGSGLLPGNDQACAVAIDADGNVYVTGASQDSLAMGNYVTVKYDSSGVRQWVARYNGPGTGFGFFGGLISDEARALAVDGAGNVYITGSSYGSETYVDYATVKYDSNGNELWVARYNGPGNGWDDATALVLDAWGNVYVTGSSDDTTSGGDYATVKYDTDGIQQWVARYNGPQNSGDEASALALDGAGNVYVTGSSEGPETFRDYATVKYNTDGDQLWVARYNGPGNDWDGVAALAVDDAGYVYVTGSSYDTTGSYDYATIKYSPAGIEQWVARYNGPGNDWDEATTLALNDSGNVFVTGSSDGTDNNRDYATVKYDTDGIQQWVARYNGPENSSDEATALALDDSGYVYVTGSSDGSGTSDDYATVKYSPGGIEQWVARYNGPGNGWDHAHALALDDAGQIYVTGESEGDYTTVKYDVGGIQQWVAGYDGPGISRDEAHAMAVDDAGNVYVTGSSYDSTGSSYATVKYSPDGFEQWVARYNSPGTGFYGLWGPAGDRATALALDDAGYVYVTGSSYDTTGSYDYATIKYSPDGIQQWVARYNGPENDWDEACALAVDDSGNVYVTGSSRDSTWISDYATVKYSPDGIELWVARYNGPENDRDGANAIAVDDAGNVFVTGESEGDYATVKYDTDGEQQWVARYNGTANASDYAFALAVDDSGNVFVSGRSEGSVTGGDYATVKYDTDGEQQWVARYNGPGNDWDEAHALAVDDSGNVYVTGTSANDYATVKYSPDGIKQWVTRYSRTEDSWESARDLAIDEAGDLYVTGHSSGGYTTVKYSSIGKELGVARYDGVGWSSAPVGLGVDGAGNVYVAGTDAERGFHGELFWGVYTTIKYDRFALALDDVLAALPVQFGLQQNYPNPFNPATTIQYDLPQRAKVTLTIYDILGREVAVLINGEQGPGYQSVIWNGRNERGRQVSTGVYLYRIQAGPQAGGFVESRKMIILR